VFTILIVVTTVVYADGLTEKGLKRVLHSRIVMIKGIAANKLIVEAVAQQNAKQLSLLQIKDIDQQWQTQIGDTPLKMHYQLNLSGKYIKAIVQSNHKIFSEIFITDNQGANVAAYPATSDYWQGDEEKWQKSWLDGHGEVFVSKLAFDESSQAHAIQISVPIRVKSKVIGVMISGIKLTHLQSTYLLRNLDDSMIKQ
jgi:hypothetical protein